MEFLDKWLLYSTRYTLAIVNNLKSCRAFFSNFFIFKYTVGASAPCSAASHHSYSVSLDTLIYLIDKS